MDNFGDIVVGLQYGDEAKGKIVYNLLKTLEYNLSVRFNGGDNAGHTIYHNGQKFVTHIIPTGLILGIKSMIGPGCVINYKTLIKEIEELKSKNIDVDNLLFIANSATIITDDNIEEDKRNDKIGSTKRGITQAYRDKYAKIAPRAEDIKELNQYLCNPVALMNKQGIKILFEGAQGYFLDLNLGKYPFVTSSSVVSGEACVNGFSPKKIRKIFGAAKAYETYVGTNKFEPDNDVMLSKIREIGQEYGATTGRPRQCNYLNMHNLLTSIEVNGVTDLIISKCDVLNELGIYKTLDPDYNFSSEESFVSFINDYLYKNTNVKNITWSKSKELI